MLKKWDLPSLTASVSAIIDVDDMISADLGSAYAENVKKSIIVLVANRLGELAPYLCLTICWGGEICPLSLPMAQQLLMLMTWMVQICELLMQDM
jgi:hypothetical protein